MLNVELKNISGLRGIHKYEFIEGLSILNAPNGSGKTSLLNALYLLITNERISPEELSRYLTEKEIDGYVKVRIRDKEFEVDLQRDDDKVKITYSNVDDTLFDNTLGELYFARGNSELYQGILSNDDTLITSWYYNVTQVQKYRLFLNIATKLLSDYRQKRDELKKKLSKDISKNQEEIDKLTREKEELEREIKEILESDDYKKFMKDHKEINKEITELRKDIKESSDKRDKIYRKIIDSEENIKNLKKKREKLKKKLEVFRANQKIIQLEFRVLEEKYDKLEGDYDKIIKDIAEKQKKLVNERGLLKDYKKLVKRETCPTCHQKLDTIVIKKLTAQSEARVTKLVKEVKSLNSKKKSILDEISVVKEKLVGIKDFLKQNEDALKEEINITETKIKELSDKVLELKEKRESLGDTIEKKQEKLIKVQESLTDENPLQEEIFKKQEKSNNIDRMIRDLESEIQESSEFQTEFLLSDERVKRADAIHRHYIQKVQYLEHDTMDRINKALKNSFELLELARLKKIEFQKKDGRYQLEIQRDNNVFTSVAKMSGAEKSLIALIINWVVSQMILPDNPLFLVDEITTEMDDTRFKDILNYISDKGNYVIVARHKPYQGKYEMLAQEHIVNSFS